MPTKPYKIKGLAVIALLIVLLLSGCYDLGSFDNDEQYYKSFSDVTIYEKFKATTYKFSDFYSKESINDFHSVLTEAPYQALTFQAKRDMRIEDFYIYFASSEKSQISMDLYITDNALSIKKDSDEEKKDEKEEFNPIDSKFLLDSTSASLSKEYEAFGFNKSDYDILENQYIIILFKQNLELNSTTNVSFQFTNILIRGIF